MVKRLINLDLIVVMAVLLLSLIVSRSQAAPAPKQPKAVTVRLATGPIQWSMYAYSVAAAEIVNRHTNLKIVVESTGGTGAILRGLNAGVMDIGGPNTVTGTIYAYGGEGQWKKPNKNLRVLIALGGMYRGYITKTGSGIKTLSDLKGKRVPYYIRDHETYEFWDAILEAYGLNPRTDLKEIRLGSTNEGEEAFRMGRVDAMMRAMASRNLLPVQEAIGNIVFVPIDPDKALQARKKSPKKMRGMHPRVLPPEYLPGIRMAGPVDSLISPRMITTTKALPDDVAYTMTKALVENYKEYKDTDPLFIPKTAAVVPDVPFHPGAVKAYKELGLWTDDMEQAQRALIAAE